MLLCIHRFLRNFGSAELTMHSEEPKKCKHSYGSSLVFFRNFATKSRELFHFVQGNFSVSAKKESILLFCSRLFVTLQEFSAFHSIKAVWGIRGKWGYDLATVLNSTFCYKLHQRTPDAEPPAVL